MSFQYPGPRDRLVSQPARQDFGLDLHVFGFFCGVIKRSNVAPPKNGSFPAVSDQRSIWADSDRSCCQCGRPVSVLRTYISAEFQSETTSQRDSRSIPSCYSFPYNSSTSDHSVFSPPRCVVTTWKSPISRRAGTLFQTLEVYHSWLLRRQFSRTNYTSTPSKM